MKTRRFAAAALLALLPATVSLSASAQDDAVTVQARARFKEGVEAFDKGRYEEARLSFLQAYALKKHPSVLLNLAQCSARSNHPVEAAKYFQQFLKESTTATPAQRKDAETGLAEVRQRIGRIDVVAPPGSEIAIDDQKVGTTPFDPVDIEVGQHTVRSNTQTVTVNAVAGQKVEARLGSTAAAAAPPPVAAVPPPASSSSEPAQPNPPPGGDSGAKHTNLLDPPENFTPVVIGTVAAGVGVLTAVVFVAFKADAQSKADTVASDIRRAAGQRGLDSQGVCNLNLADFANACRTLRDNNDKVDTNATLANVGVGVAIAGAAFAVGWYLLAPKRGERTSHAPVLSPYAGAGTGGLNLAGQF